jgi:broad specificity phosphatase PhoE
LGALIGLGIESYWKLRVDNCSLSVVDTYPEGAIVSLLNDVCHLSELPNGGGVP